MPPFSRWPRWRILQVNNVTHVVEDRWAIDTPIGLAELRVKRNAAVGTIEYAFTAGDLQWAVPGRVPKNGAGSELVLTLFRHEAISKLGFELLSTFVDQELAWLKKLVELQ